VDGILDKKYAEGRNKKRSLKYRLWRRSNEVIRGISQYIIPISSKKIKLLDLGCADGLMINNITKVFDVEAVGIELADDLFQLAKKSCPLSRIYNADVKSLSFLNNEKFDVIICTAVLEHLEDTTQAIKNIENLLSDNGITIWTVPDPFWEHIATSVGHLDEEQHHHIPDLKELIKLAENNNLKILEAKKFMFSPIGFPFEIFIEKILRKLRLSSIMANQLVIAKKNN